MCCGGKYIAIKRKRIPIVLEKLQTVGFFEFLKQIAVKQLVTDKFY
jgi:hypothetical protein